jgi:hypothetical protein
MTVSSLTLAIQLTSGYVSIVDAVDYEKVAAYKWFPKKDRSGNIYAVANQSTKGGKPPKQLFMHRLVLDITDPKIQVDHRDNDGLNNTRLNLRSATHGQNQHNSRKHAKGSSNYKGVMYYSKTGKWKVSISINGHKKHLGYFESETDAACAYDKAARIYFGDFALCNFPLKKPCLSARRSRCVDFSLSRWAVQ